MKTTILKTPLLIALLVAPALAGNDKTFTYLALGDSVSFGMNPLILAQYPNVTSNAFVGYPETVATDEHIPLINASCPGESSTSFLLGVAPDDLGCNLAHLNPFFPAFKTPHLGLMHVEYAGPQMQYAISQLQTNKTINLVTLSIGANDVLAALSVCGAAPTPTCTAQALAHSLPTYAANLGQILHGIRNTAHYNGTIILVGYYSPTSTPFPGFDPIAIALDTVMAAVGVQYRAKFVDGFTAFKVASLPSGDACTAGLVIALPPTVPAGPPCDIHPTDKGRAILARLVELAQ